jgi:hypothetical protein
VDVVEWVREQGGIVHRDDVLDRQVGARRLRELVAFGSLRRIRRYWLAVDTAPPALVSAAQWSGRVACVSAARHRGWWVHPDADRRLHLHLTPNAQRPTGCEPTVLHWTLALTPVHRRRLVESIEDSLQHIADCLPREQALVLWEDAARVERIAPGRRPHRRAARGAARRIRPPLLLRPAHS